MKNFKVNLFKITIISCFLVYFAFIVGDFIIPWYFITTSGFIAFMLSNDTKYLFSRLKKFVKTNSFKLFLTLFFIICISIIISVFTEKFYLSGFIRNFLGSYTFSITLAFLLPIIALPRVMNYRNFIKFLILVILGIFLLGILEFIGSFYKIKVVNLLFNLLSNRSNYMYKLDEKDVVFAFGIPRISSIFLEPSILGYFCVIISPILYKICLSKNKLFSNSFTDIFIKNFTLFLLFLNLILTQSPIFLVFSVLVIISALLIRFYITHKKLFLTSTSIAMTGLVCLIFVYINFNDELSDFIPNLNLQNSYLGRIQAVTQNLASVDAFILAEPSLATRVTKYANQFVIFLKNPVFGIGYGNLDTETNKQVLKSPFSVTTELYNCALKGDPGGGVAIFFKFIAETGILGTSILYLFFLNFIISSSKKIKYYSNIEKDFIIGLKYFMIILILTSFYDSFPNSPIMWIFIGTLQAMLIDINKKSRPLQVVKS